ncbi:MAG: hypothetical protein PHV82_18015, partial [Victivallaceae bacterium]|nr:hypothetical protein [Victivallaceae bacterium]
KGLNGWKKFATDKGTRYNVWKYYRLPANCMKASAWGAVMSGARLFFCWSYSPPSKEEAQFTFKSTAETDKREIFYMTLAGRAGIPNPQLAEFNEAGKEIRPYENIITEMSKLPQSPVVTGTKQFIFNEAFSLPAFKGKIVVLHNANVGTWPRELKVDDVGNLIGYEAYTQPAIVEFTIANNEETGKAVYDILTGKEIVKNEGKYQVPIMPGSGRLIYIGSAAEAELLHKRVK